MEYLFGALIFILGVTFIVAGGTMNASNLFQTVTGHAQGKTTQANASPATPSSSAAVGQAVTHLAVM